LISNIRRVLNVVFFLLGDSSASEFYVPTFRNTLSSIFIGRVSRKNKRDKTARVLIQVVLKAYQYAFNTSSVCINGLYFNWHVTSVQKNSPIMMYWGVETCRSF